MAIFYLLQIYLEQRFFRPQYSDMQSVTAILIFFTCVFITTAIDVFLSLLLSEI